MYRGRESLLGKGLLPVSDASDPYVLLGVVTRLANGAWMRVLHGATTEGQLPCFQGTPVLCDAGEEH